MTLLVKFRKIARLILLVGLISMFPLPAAKTGANTISVQALPELLPRKKEIELALSAAPEHLRKDAAVYMLHRNGFVKIGDSTNGFTCIVNRDPPKIRSRSVSMPKEQ